jgi:lipopolysaccharide export system permease protein
MAAVQYGMLVVAMIIGMLIIVRGIVVDAPAGVIETFNRNNARLLRLFGRPVTA